MPRETLHLVSAQSKSAHYWILYDGDRPLDIYVADYSGVCAAEHAVYAICDAGPRSDARWWQMRQTERLPMGTRLEVARERASAYAEKIGLLEAAP